MANQTLTTNPVTFLDYTDERKLDVYISSNFPTTQIFDTNQKTYSPNWSEANPLVLTADVYLDAKDVTTDVKTDIKWFEQVGTNSEVEINYGDTLIIDSNKMASNALLTYICKAKYDDNGEDSPAAIAKLTFTRVDTGLNGSDGSSAPAVQAQYSVDGKTNWTPTLNTATHKYIRYSYDGGKTWTTEIKMVGEDGTSVNIKGTATSKDLVSGTSYYTLVYNSATITGATVGDAYLLDGNLYVCVDSKDGNDHFMDVGRVQGPQGNDGQSSYVFIRYAPASPTDANMTDIPGSTTTHIGICTVNTNVAPKTASSYTWSKFVGDSAKNIVLSGDSQVFKGSKTTPITYTPSTIRLTANRINIPATTVLTWSYNHNDNKGWTATKPDSVTISGDVATITGSKLTTNSLTIKVSDGSVEDVFTVYRAFDGADGGKGDPASMAFLTNENVSFSANANGIITASPITTNVVAYRGTTKQMPTIGTISGAPSGMTITTRQDTLLNEIELTISFTSGTNLGLSTSTSGTITIPITAPVVTNLKLSWSKINSGATGVGIKSVTEHYLATSLSSGVTTSTTGWTEAIQTITVTNKYLWNYETITYTNNTTTTTTPIIIGVFGNTGNTGKGIKSVVEYYLATNLSSGVSMSTTDWTTTMQALTATKKYLWNYELITYTDDTTATINPVIIGVYGDKGDKGDKGNDAYTVILTNESHIFAGDVSNAIAGTATTQVLAYNGSDAQSVTIVSVNGKTAATTDTDTGIAGLKFKCSALSGSPTITFTCTTAFVSKSGSIPIVLSVGGVSFTKMFTYSIAFKGTAGNPGSPASLVDITPSAYYFKSTTGKDGTFTPDYIYLYPRFQTVTFSKWEYSINGGTTWVAASGANGLSISTYNSVENTLRIAKTSTLYTDSVTSISFRCVSSTASVYDTVSIAKIYDVVDLQIGGRNLLQRTDNTQKTLTINTNKYGVIGQFVPSTQSWKNGYVDISEYGLSIGDTLTFQAYLIPQNAMPVAVRAWGSSNGTSGSPLKDGNYLLEPGVSSCTFTMTHQYLYLGVAVQDTVTSSITEKYSNCKLERGNKATDWSPAPEDLNNITFQIYAPNGYLLTHDLQSIALQTFAYEGSIEITSGATFQWSQLIDDVWTNIGGATNTSLTVSKSDVLKAKSYRCVMTYKSKTYTSTITVQDKTDTYNSIMCISSNAKGSECYWVLYTLAYSDTEEIDPLLGPISISAPASPVSGDYWYAVDTVNATVQLKKYNGTAWDNSTDKQSLTYLWNLVNDGSLKTPIGGASKVQVVSCHDFTATATIVCDVSNDVDGILTQSSLSITDASDPIISQTEPTSAVDGQIWIKPNTNGAYNMFLWSEAAQTWIANDMDTRNKVYTSKPSAYSKGDIWITESDTAHSKYLEGTLLQASNDNTTYSENDWSATLKYDKDIEKINDTLYDLSQYVTITSSGLKIGAVNSSNELSPFTSLFTSTELAFYQNSDKLLTLANNQLTAPRIVVEEELEVNKKISLGNLQITIENNGSFSFAVTK